MFKQRAVKLLKQSTDDFGLAITIDAIEGSLDKPKKPEQGDLASNLCFKIAKELNRPPNEIAMELVKILSNFSKNDPLYEKIEAVGPYLNFFFDSNQMTIQIANLVIAKGTEYGSSDHGQDRKIIIEHTSVNPVGPLHIGNLRNAVLGDIVARMHQASGWNVEVQNLVDDLGRQMAILVWGFLNRVHIDVPRTEGMKYDVWLGLVYSEANKRVTEENLDKIIGNLMQKIKKNKDYFLFNRALAEKCVESNLETSWSLNIAYDLLIWESDISFSGVWEETLLLLEKSPHFSWVKSGEKKNCFVAHMGNLSDFKDAKDPDKVLIRSNKVPTYLAHDIALQLWKFGLTNTIIQYRPLYTQSHGNENRQLWTSTPSGVPVKTFQGKFGNADRVCNVIGFEQDYLQNIVKHTLNLLQEQDKSENSFHLSYKHVILPTQRFSGRTGNWYETGGWGDEVLRKTIHAAYEVVAKKRDDLDEGERRQIARKIGIGALRYWLAKFSTETEIKFIIDDVVDLEGDTAPFILYSIVRARNILKKAGTSDFSKSYEKIKSKWERILVIKIGEFPEILFRATESMSPHFLTTYAYELASTFNKFYETCPVIGTEDPELRAQRISLVKVTVQTLENVVNILGLPVPDQM